MAYSLDLRERAVALAKTKNKSEVARLLKVDRESVSEWVKRAEAGKLAHNTSTGRPRLIDGEAEKLLGAQVEAHKDATLEEHCQEWSAKGQGKVSRATMHRSLERLEVSRKKRPSKPVSAMKKSENNGG
jgi:transposase